MAPYPNTYELPDRSPLTVDEYLAYDQGSEMRSEYWKGLLIPMPGGSPEHGRIILDINTFLNQQLAELGYQVWNGNTRVKVADWGYAYPDGMVVVGKAQFLKEKGVSSLLNPALLIEVLLASTADFDLIEKFEFYKEIPTFQEYLVVSQTEPLVRQHTRQADGEWTLNKYRGMDASIPLVVTPLVLPLAIIYKYVDFSDGE